MDGRAPEIEPGAVKELWEAYINSLMQDLRLLQAITHAGQVRDIQAGTGEPPVADSATASEDDGLAGHGHVPNRRALRAGCDVYLHGVFAARATAARVRIILCS